MEGDDVEQAIKASRPLPKERHKVLKDVTATTWRNVIPTSAYPAKLDRPLVFVIPPSANCIIGFSRIFLKIVWRGLKNGNGKIVEADKVIPLGL